LCLIEDLKSLIAANEYWQPTDAILRCSLALLHGVLSRPELRWQPPVSPTLERVRRFIEGSHARPLGNPELAKLAGMAVSRFIPAFLATFGSTPARYVAEVRVREAARMLVQSDASIDEIAERTGFPNRAYFSRVFRKITRDSPAAFRKRRLGQRSHAAG
jgi:transcriptional regulator GlxA family with amidase domain